jgi:apolipoprotein D and lipocalin family protein
MWKKQNNRNNSLTFPTVAASLALIAGTTAYLRFKRKIHAPLEVVPYVDLGKYMGEWFEIAKLPAFFETNCYQPKANYSLNDDGSIHVVNSCRKNGASGKLIKAEATAYVADSKTNARLKLKYNRWPFITGDYEIIDLGSEYEYVMVGTSNRKYLWILSRAPQLEVHLIKDLLKKASDMEFDTTRLIFNRQDSW